MPCFKRRIFPFPADEVSHSKQQHLSKARRDLAAAGAGRLVNTSSNKLEIDWEVGADKQLCSEEKEVKSHPVWLALYHWANPRCHTVHLLKSVRALAQLFFFWKQKWIIIWILHSRPLSGFVHLYESLQTSIWCHRETYSTKTQLLLQDFFISQTYQHNFRVQCTIEQLDVLQECISLK